ncbi:Hsp20/alpha crystallin family protein [Isoptericola sp. BMS4]|uniref:Hsp20/alpha crystallin family protein n=1 Tax=Isoptericola sp. BMS4 TaxID=2527875 RepID=UPI001423D388|nr:Hsp20/alpha crystallin family protein [Isoptericola sp. BMS4]
MSTEGTRNTEGTGTPAGGASTTTSAAHRSGRELAEHLTGLWPPRWDAWPFTEVFAGRDPGPGVGALIRVEEAREGDELVIRAELPGLDPEKDVEVTVDDGILTIAAHREERTSEHEGGYRSEFRYGQFERRLRLPRDASSDVTATYRDGVLEVRVPVPAERPAARTIEVRRA